jgi:RpiB/LacA/LacB family sugar-phosphate isomerase
MKIFIGADHRGFEFKKKIKDFLGLLGHEVIDVGTHEEGKDCDYPQISHDVAVQVAKDASSRGILVCLTGLGHSIAANKIPGVYAALVYNIEAASLSRKHNNSNVLVLGARFTESSQMLEIVKTWLSTDFEGGRHLRRVQQIKKIEREFLTLRKL